MNIAILSFWHVHGKDYAKQLSEIEDAKLTAVWDCDISRGKEKALEYGVEFYEDLNKLLASPDIDGVVCCAPTNMHKEVLIKCANAGKHIFTEKVLTLTYEDALEVKEAVDKSGVMFTICLFQRCHGNKIEAKRIADSGELGKITHARVRNVHTGKSANWLPEHFYDKTACGGGAMVDLGAHPMYLLQWILGDEKKVSSLFTNALEQRVEDNAVSVIEFDEGKIGIAETAFVSAYTPTIVEISGTEGRVVTSGFTNLYKATAKTDGQLVPVEFGEDKPLPLAQWINSIKTGIPTKFDINEAVKLTRLMEKAYKAII